MKPYKSSIGTIIPVTSMRSYVGINYLKQHQLSDALALQLNINPTVLSISGSCGGTVAAPKGRSLRYTWDKIEGNLDLACV